MFNKLTVKDIKVKNKVVLVRTDYNVPLEDGKVTSDFRIRASLPTLNYLLEQGAKKIILISHLGRPDGKRNKAFSLAPVAQSLQSLLPEHKIVFVDDVSGPDVESAAKKLKKGEIMLLENLRFFPGEEKNSEDFIREIVDSVNAEVYIQDGFAVIHRAHASTSAVQKFLPVYAGLLVEKEVSALEKVKNNPDHPFLMLIGGSKVEDKQPLIEKFLDSADKIAVGGKIAADGYESSDPKIYVAEDFDETTDEKKLDIGPIATSKIVEQIESAKTVVWNGLLGYVEDPTYATASTIVAKVLGENPKITSVICGGDTTGFVENLMSETSELHYSLVSTGGGASLELLLDEPLPGLDAIENHD